MIHTHLKPEVAEVIDMHLDALVQILDDLRTARKNPPEKFNLTPETAIRCEQMATMTIVADRIFERLATTDPQLAVVCHQALERTLSTYLLCLMAFGVHEDAVDAQVPPCN